MPLILVIEDEPVSRILCAQALSGIDGLSVVSAGTVLEAKAMLEHTSPDLVLLDLRLPDGTGLELISVMTARGTQPAVIIISAFLEDLDPEQRQGRLIVLPKPIDYDKLRGRVKQVLALDRDSYPFSMPEYLQMACLGRHSLLLRSVINGEIGEIAVHDGDVWAASFGELRAFAAFYALASIEQCAIEVRPWPESDLPERQLVGSYQELLLEAARRQDEGAKGEVAHFEGDELDFSDLLRSYPPQQNSAPPIHITEDNLLNAADLVAEGVRAVIARDYATAVRLLERAHELDPENKSIRHRLERLYELGHSARSI